MPGFIVTGNRYLGMQSYPALMKEVAKRTKLIEVKDMPPGGVGIRYVPGDSED